VLKVTLSYLENG